MAYPRATTALLGQNRRITASFVGIGIALGVLLWIPFGVVEAPVPESMLRVLEATDGWVLWLLFVGGPAVFAYRNGGLLACWLFDYAVLFPFFLVFSPMGDAGDARIQVTLGEQILYSLTATILFGLLAFFLGIGVRLLVGRIIDDTSSDLAGVTELLFGRNWRRAAVTSLAGFVPGGAVVAAYGFDVPLMGRGLTGPEHRMLHLLLVGVVLACAAFAAFAAQGLVPAWLFSVGFLWVVYAASYGQTYGTGQPLFSGGITGVTFGSVGFLVGIFAQWVVSWRRSSSTGGEPSV